MSGYVICRDTEAEAQAELDRLRAYEEAGVGLMLLQFSPQREEMARFGQDVISHYPG